MQSLLDVLISSYMYRLYFYIATYIYVVVCILLVIDTCMYVHASMLHSFIGMIACSSYFTSTYVGYKLTLETHN